MIAISRHLLTDGEAAEMLRMPPSRLRKLANTGQVDHVLLPDGEVRFVEADLWDWVESHKQKVEGGRCAKR